jgi:hypothetical protein
MTMEAIYSWIDNSEWFWAAFALIFVGVWAIGVIWIRINKDAERVTEIMDLEYESQAGGGELDVPCPELVVGTDNILAELDGNNQPVEIPDEEASAFCGPIYAHDSGKALRDLILERDQLRAKMRNLIAEAEHINHPFSERLKSVLVAIPETDLHLF